MPGSRRVTSFVLRRRGPIEELAFLARYQPGLKALSERERDAATEQLKRERPELEERLSAERERVATLKRFFTGDTGYVGSGADPDLYNFFRQRYRRLLGAGGCVAVVLPRTAFSAKGSTGFRRWLFEICAVERLDFLLNRRRWMFDTHPQYTIALLVAVAAPPRPNHQMEVAGVADFALAFAEQSAAPGRLLALEALGPLLEVPLLSSQPTADLLAKLRRGTAFPYGSGRWRCFPTRELHETDDKEIWQRASEGVPLWKGESFDQYDPHGSEQRLCPLTDETRDRARRPKAGSESSLASEIL